MTMCSAVRRRMLLIRSTVSPAPVRGAGRAAAGEAGRPAAGAGAGAGRGPGGGRAAPDDRALSTSARVTRPPMPEPLMFDRARPFSSTRRRTTGDTSAAGPEGVVAAGRAGAGAAGVGAGAGEGRSAASRAGGASAGAPLA